MTHLVLTGLKGHHPLGFLAACGLLRSIVPTLDARLSWQHVPESPTERVAVICSDAAGDQDSLKQSLLSAVADAATQYLQTVGQNGNLGLKTDQPSRKDLRQVGRALIDTLDFANHDDLMACAVLSSVGSDLIASASDDKKIEKSKLIMTTGKRDLFKSAGLQPAKDLSERNDQGDPTPRVIGHIEEALFGPWRYKDDAHPQGLDPNFQRFHALRNKEPTNDRKQRSVTAAVFLAYEALLLFPCFAVNGKLRTTAIRKRNGTDCFEWPLWKAPISLATLRSLLSSELDHTIVARGVDVLYRSRRIGVPTAGGITYYLSPAQEWSPGTK